MIITGGMVVDLVEAMRDTKVKELDLHMTGRYKIVVLASSIRWMDG